MNKIFRFIIALRNRIVIFIRYQAEIKNIDKKTKLWESVVLDESQTHEIKSIWGRYLSGKDVTKWHRLYQSYTGLYQKDYFPENLYSTKLEPILSPDKYSLVLAHKYLTTCLFPGDDSYRNPNVFVANTSNVFTNSWHEVISSEQALSCLKDIGNAVIKPTIDSSSGEGIRMINIKNGVDIKSNETIESILAQYKTDYIVQERITQSVLLTALYPNAINTFRVVTYICDGVVHVAPVALRVGRGNAEVDNIHAGGISIGVNDNCCLREIAFSEMGDRFDTHPNTGISFKGYKIQPLEQVIACAKRLHGRIPMIKMISWDWTLDENNIPVLIETNLTGQAVWLPQMVNGQPMFGENTQCFRNLIK